MPPPSTVGCSCVYVVRREDGFFYCGESDDIKGAFSTPPVLFDPKLKALCKDQEFCGNWLLFGCCWSCRVQDDEAMAQCSLSHLPMQGGWRGTGEQGLSREAELWRRSTWQCLLVRPHTPAACLRTPNLELQTCMP